MTNKSDCCLAKVKITPEVYDALATISPDICTKCGQPCNVIQKSEIPSVDSGRLLTDEERHNAITKYLGSDHSLTAMDFLIEAQRDLTVSLVREECKKEMGKKYHENVKWLDNAWHKWGAGKDNEIVELKAEIKRLARNSIQANENVVRLNNKINKPQAEHRAKLGDK